MDVQTDVEKAIFKSIKQTCGKVADYIERNPILRKQPTEDMFEYRDKDEDVDDEEEEEWDDED